LTTAASGAHLESPFAPVNGARWGLNATRLPGHAAPEQFDVGQAGPVLGGAADCANRPCPPPSRRGRRCRRG
jgi:hypothetical protein